MRMRLAVAMAALAVSGAVYGEGMVTQRMADVVAPAVVPFGLDQVKLLDGPFKRAQELDKAYLLSLDADRLLHTFRLNVGMPSMAVPYGGWEKPDCELRGHFVGHYLSACALMYRSTGDAVLKDRTDYLVGELAKCQAASEKAGFHVGYLAAFPEELFDRVDAQKKVWAPWYTMHKIMAGLLDVYTETGNKQALDVDTKLADWVKFRVDRLTPEQMQGSLKNEQGGMTEVMANLAGVTGNKEYLRVAEAFNHHAVIDPLANGVDNLNKLHANTQIPKIIGAAREYELTGNKDYHNIAQFFWKDVAQTRSYAFGGHSDNEHFFPVTDFEKHLSFATAETCNTYNMLRLTRHLFQWNPSAELMDFYERGLYNQILASQDDAGMMIYFMSTKPGHFKTYMTPEDSFWCCTGTGTENHAKYGDSIYFHNPANDQLFVNLYIPSTLEWKDKNISIRQETKFPEEETTRLTIHTVTPQRFALAFRSPAWAAKPGIHLINNRPIPADALAHPETAAHYTTIDRQWNDGDVLTLQFPFTVHLESLPNSRKMFAVMDGPIVLAGDLGPDGLDTAQAKDQKDLAKIKDAPVPAVVAASIADVLKNIAPAADGKPLTFTMTGLSDHSTVTLRPLYEITRRRYTVYWDSASN